MGKKGAEGGSAFLSEIELHPDGLYKHVNLWFPCVRGFKVKCVLQASRGSTDVQSFSLGKPGVIPQHVLQMSPGVLLRVCVVRPLRGKRWRGEEWLLSGKRQGRLRHDRHPINHKTLQAVFVAPHLLSVEETKGLDWIGNRKSARVGLVPRFFGGFIIALFPLSFPAVVVHHQPLWQLHPWQVQTERNTL